MKKIIYGLVSLLALNLIGMNDLEYAQPESLEMDKNADEEHEDLRGFSCGSCLKGVGLISLGSVSIGYGVLHVLNETAQLNDLGKDMHDDLNALSRERNTYGGGYHCNQEIYQELRNNASELMGIAHAHNLKSFGLAVSATTGVVLIWTGVKYIKTNIKLAIKHCKKEYRQGKEKRD